MKSIVKKRYWVRLVVAVIAMVSAAGLQSASHASDTETLLLMISDGAPGSNAFQDISGNNIQVTPGGNAHHSTAQPKFGDTAIRFDGSGDYLNIYKDLLAGIGYGDFTVDLWVYLNASDMCLISGSGIGISQWYGYLSAGVAGVGYLSAGALPVGSWHHIAMVRHAGQLILYTNGVAAYSIAVTEPYSSTSSSWVLGMYSSPYITLQLNGYVDALRVTKGAIWTSNFIPPTKPVPIVPVKWVSTDNNALVTDGNVGIGTSAPGSALAVNGTITAREIVVTDADWADFVFDQSYVLPDLTSVESYINQNRHLPGIPQSSTIAKSGISVSEMFRLQMQKIEELTLYVIALEKQNRKMVEKIRLLKVEKSQRLHHE